MNAKNVVLRGWGCFVVFWLGNLCEGDSPSLKSHGPLMMLIFTYNASLAMEEFSLRYSFHMSGKSVTFFIFYDTYFPIKQKHTHINMCHKIICSSFHL